MTTVIILGSCQQHMSICANEEDVTAFWHVTCSGGCMHLLSVWPHPFSLSAATMAQPLWLFWGEELHSGKKVLPLCVCVCVCVFVCVSQHYSWKSWHFHGAAEESWHLYILYSFTLCWLHDIFCCSGHETTLLWTVILWLLTSVATIRKCEKRDVCNWPNAALQWRQPVLSLVSD